MYVCRSSLLLCTGGGLAVAAAANTAGGCLCTDEEPPLRTTAASISIQQNQQASCNWWLGIYGTDMYSGAHCELSILQEKTILLPRHCTPCSGSSLGLVLGQR